MPPKSSSKSPKGTVKPRTPVTSLRGSGTSTTANPFGALNDESVAAADGHVDNKEDEEHDDSEDDEQQICFEGVVESDANALLDRVESLNGHSSGDPYFSSSVRQDFVEIYSGLNDNGYNDDDKSAVAEMLKTGNPLRIHCRLFVNLPVAVDYLRNLNQVNHTHIKRKFKPFVVLLFPRFRTSGLSSRIAYMVMARRLLKLF